MCICEIQKHSTFNYHFNCSLFNSHWVLYGIDQQRSPRSMHGNQCEFLVSQNMGDTLLFLSVLDL